jgi:hypothetical protein
MQQLSEEFYHHTVFETANLLYDLEKIQQYQPYED